jgi:hypothetical protein
MKALNKLSSLDIGDEVRVVIQEDGSPMVDPAEVSYDDFSLS